jgi:glycosyltransferase involved in cell wall biosynthesis
MGTIRKAIVASRIYAPEGGAASFRLAALVHALEAAHCTVTVLTTRTPGSSERTRNIRRWPVFRDRTGAVRGYLQYASFDIPLFLRLLVARRSDVVVVEPPPTTGAICRLVCRLRDIPYVYFSADVASTAARGIGVNRVVVALLRRLESWVLRGAASVLAVSDGVRDEVIAMGVDPHRVAVVGTGIDTDVFSSVGPTRHPHYSYFVYAGTMSEIQGAGVFVEAFGRIAARHPNARLLMFGQGVELEHLKERAQHLANDQIVFPGLVSGDEIASWLRGAHAGLASVRPDRGYDFAFATKAFASLGCGTPVIYSGVGPVHDIVRDNQLGWAVSWSVDDVASAMEEALNLCPSAPQRERLTGWTERNYSLRTVSAKAVTAIIRAVATTPIAGR